MKEIKAVMYHYVRDYAAAQFPKIKGRCIEEFRAQLDYFESNFQILNPREFFGDPQVWNDGSNLVGIILTFDDGFREHYDVVFSELKSRGLKGAFYPPAKPIQSRIVLDVHKVHHILACVHSIGNLTEMVCDYLTKKHYKTDLLWERFAVSNEWDSAEVIFCKRILQHAIEPEHRSELTNLAFSKYVKLSEAQLAEKLYLSEDQIQEMHNNGMSFGIHGYDHLWLGESSIKVQKRELNKSLRFFNNLNIDVRSIAYPYGSYNESTLGLCGENKIDYGFTTAVGNITPKTSPLEFPRFDTNHFQVRNRANGI